MNRITRLTRLFCLLTALMTLCLAMPSVLRAQATPALTAYLDDTGLHITVTNPQPDACLWLGGPDRPLVQLPLSCGVSTYLVPPNDPSAPRPGNILSLVRQRDDRVLAGIILHQFIAAFPLAAMPAGAERLVASAPMALAWQVHQLQITIANPAPARCLWLVGGNRRDTPLPDSCGKTRYTLGPAYQSDDYRPDGRIMRLVDYGQVIADLPVPPDPGRRSLPLVVGV